MLQNKNPYQFKMTKRLLYQQITDEANPEVLVGSSRSTDRNAMRQRLAQLEEQVHNRDQREHLADLRESVDFQRDAIAEDGREVQDLLRMAQVQGGLETQDARKRFFENFEQRFSVFFALLVQSGQVSVTELRSDDLVGVIATKNPAQMKVKFRGSDRSLFDHEKNLLSIPALLKNHSNTEVKKLWEETAMKIRANAAVMTAFGVDMTGSGRSQSGVIKEALLSGLELSPEHQEMLGKAKDYWRGMHPLAQAAVLATAVYGAWSIYKWVFRRGSDNEPGRLSKIGFLVAGGVFVAGGILGYRAVWDKIKGLFVGLSRGQFLRGIRAVISGDWDAAKRAWGSFADGILQRLGLREQAGASGGSQPERTNTNASTPETTAQNREQLRYAATRDTLIGFFCISERTYSSEDRREIRQVFNAMRGQSVHQIAQLWQRNKTNTNLTIPHNTGIVQIENNIQEKNIFTAVRIIGSAYEIYQRRFQLQANTPLTLGQFLERIAGDPLHEVGSAVHQAVLQVAADGTINFSQLNLNRLREHFSQRQRQHTSMVCNKLGVEIQSLTDQEKNDFYALAASLYRDANLVQSADQALQNIGTTGRSSRAIEKAREFFTQTKQRTLQTVLPGVISRFNIEQAQNSRNANILRNNLTEQRMTFGHAFQLNVVSANFNFSQSEAATEFEELSLLFVALHGLPTEERNRYYSELSYLMLNSDTTITLPSLARLKPYFGRVASLAGEVLENKGRTLLELLSAFANERTPDQERAFQERVRNSDWLEFGLITGQEGVRGSYLVGKDIALTLASVGASFEDFSSIEDAGDLVRCIWNFGGSLIYRNDDGNSTGMIYLAGKYFLFKPVGIGIDTLRATIGDGPGAGIKTYVVGASTYVMLGAVGGGISGGGWRGIIRGAARGLAAPITAPIEGIRVGQRIAETVRQRSAWGQLRNVVRSSNMLEHYREVVSTSREFSEWASREGATEAWRRLTAGNWNANRYQYFLEKFRRNYNAFFNFSDADKLKFLDVERGTEYLKVKEVSERLNNFIRTLSSHPDFARATDVDSLRTLVQRVGNEVGLVDKELAGLVTKVESNGGVQSLRSSIETSAEMLGSASRTSRSRAAFNAAVEGYRRWRTSRGLTTPSSSPAASAVDTVQRPIARTTLVTDVFEAIRARETIDMARMAQLDEALRTPEGVQEARRALSSMGVADDQIQAVIRSVRSAENPVSLSNALQRAGIIGEAPVTTMTPAATTTLREATQLSAHLDEALETIRNGGRINWRQLGALRQAAQSEDFVASLRNAGVAADKADELATVLRSRRELSAIAQSLEGLGTSVRLSRGLNGLLKVGRIAGPAFAAAGFAAGGLEAWQSWAIAEEIQNNDELKELYNQRGNVNLAAAVGNLIIDVAAIGGAISGAAALPLTVILGNIAYVYNAASEASIEIAKSEEDWQREMYQKAFTAAGIERQEGKELSAEQVLAIKGQAVNLMLHAIVNTTEDDSAGENFNALFTSNTVESFMDERANTRQKMMWAILKIEQPGKSDDYYKYAFKAIDIKVGNFNFDNIEHGKKVLAESLIFADIMSKRDQTLTYRYADSASQEPTVAGSQREALLQSEGVFDNGQIRVINLQHSRFDADNLTNREIYMVIGAGQDMVETALKNSIGEQLFERLEGLDKNYLNYAINILMLYVKDSSSPAPVAGKTPQQLAEAAELIRRYLMFEGYQFQANPNLGDPAAHMEDIAAVLFNASTSDAQLQEHMSHFIPSSKGIAALYVYACAYGYKRGPNILELQRFFEGEGKKDYMGLYFRKDADMPGGGEWVVNEEGLESDNECGSNPDTAVLKIIEEIRDEPDNILTSRFDYFADALVTRDDEVKRSKWMLELANRMERAYNRSSAPANTEEYQTPTEAAVESLSTDTSRGYQSLSNDPLTGLKMAAEEANDVTVRNLDRITGGRYSSTINSIRNKVGDLLGGILD